MADTKLPDLTTIGTLDKDDLIYVVDDPGGAPVDRKSTVGNISGVVTNALAYENRPSAGVAGRVFFPTDGLVVQRDTGSAWNAWGPIVPLTDPTIAGPTTWVNQGSSAVSPTNGGIILTGAATGSGANLVLQVKTAPATPYTITAYLMPPCTMGKRFHGYGLCFRQTSTSEIAVLDVLSVGTTGTSFLLRSSKYTSATAFSADYTSAIMSPCPWFRIEDNGTNRICSISANGLNWVQFHSVGRTDFLTADQVGFFVSTENGVAPNLDNVVTLLSWVEA